jgi:Icc-related predicted phosphoesterase
MWAYHGPPEGPLSWTGKRFYGDPELPRLIELHRPDLVLCGHIHEAPFMSGGAWSEQRGGTWLFNSGQHPGQIPAHTFLDLDQPIATWWSAERSGELPLLEALPG